MIRNLTSTQIVDLLRTVFDPRPGERGLAILVDLPSADLPDTPAWKDRRRMAAEWYTLLQEGFDALPFASLACYAYPNVGSNNGDLPETITLVDSVTRGQGPPAASAVPLREVLNQSSVVLAMTELSATAPLKLLARELPFRGATLPGFSREMLPALLLDYEKVNERVVSLKNLLDEATGATLRLSTGGKAYELTLDLRFRSGHASGGVIREEGTVANIPSGEAYIVPYEGEREGEPSKTEGILPVQFESEVVLFQVKGNRVVGVISTGTHSALQSRKVQAEPAYGNIAELGLGVLSDWGVTAVGSTLLDEKLGLHVAFGRSDHFGGAVGAKDFGNPRNVVHIDWVYVDAIQPLIRVNECLLHLPGREVKVYENDKLVL